MMSWPLTAETQKKLYKVKTSYDSPQFHPYKVGYFQAQNVS